MKLKDISVYEEKGRFYMKLTYVYADAKGNAHTRVYPKVDFPITLSTDLPVVEEMSFGPGMLSINDLQISYGDVFIHTGSVSVPANIDIAERVGPGPLKEPVPDISTDVSRYNRVDDVYFADYISKPCVKEMTLEEIERRLGYKVKVVSSKEETIELPNIHGDRNRAFASSESSYVLYPGRTGKKCNSCKYKCYYCTEPDDDPCWTCKLYSNYKKKEKYS